MNTVHNISDRDLVLIRLRFLDLLKSFFAEEPDAERVSRWRGIFTALSQEQINQQIDTAIATLVELLNNKDLKDLKTEYYALFTDPFSEELLPLNASYFLDGKNFGPSLVRYRELLKTAQLVKVDEVADPDDSLLLMLDVLVALIEEEKHGSGQTKELQSQLLRQFLLPTVEHLNAEAVKNPKADFYRQCFIFLNEYMELEKSLLIAN